MQRHRKALGKISRDYIKKATLLSRQGKEGSEAATVVTNKIPIPMKRRTTIITYKVLIAMMTTIMREKIPKAGKRRRKMRTTIMTYTTQQARKRRRKRGSKAGPYSKSS